MTLINGVHLNLHTLSDKELMTGLGYVETRLEQVWQDLAKYNGELALRPHLVKPESEVTLSLVSTPEPPNLVA